MSRNITKFVIIGGALAISAIFAHTANAAGYRITGSMEKRIFNLDESILRTVRSEFTVSVSDCAWSIRVIPGSGHSGLGVFSAYKSDSDGTNTFQTRSGDPDYDNTEDLKREIRWIDEILESKKAGNTSTPKTEKLKRLKTYFEKNLELNRTTKRTGIRPETRNDEVGFMTGQVFPFDWRDEAPKLWMAFASGCFLRNPEGDKLPILWHPEHPGQRYSHNLTKAEWTLHSNPPHLPASATLFNPGVSYWGDSQSKIRATPNKKPYDKGYVKARYEASDFVSFEGHDIPHLCTTTVYMPKKEASSNEDLRIGAIVTAKVSKVVRLPASANLARPSWTAKTHVTDLRFADGESAGVTYYVSPGKWTSSSDVGQLRDGSKVRAGPLNPGSRPVNESSAKPRAIVLIVFATVSLAFLASIWTTRNRQSKQEPAYTKNP